MIVFEYPHLAFLFFLPFLLRLFRSNSAKFSRALKIPFLKDLIKIQNSKSNFASLNAHHGFGGSFWLLFICYAFLVLSIMRPVELGEPQNLKNKGRDILLVTDISTSMLEKDFYYRNNILTRIDAVRAVVADFVQNRLHDRLGLILFGTQAYVQAPLTFDKEAVLDVLSNMQAGMAGESTAIGDALALALKTLRQTKTQKENQVIILLTDGENNDGEISVAEAVRLAKSEGIKIYTVGIGSPHMSLIKAVLNVQNSGLDEQTLKELADETKGRYFKVTNLRELINVYKKIDELEEQDFEDRVIYEKKELYNIPLLIAFVLAFTALFAQAVSGRSQ